MAFCKRFQNITIELSLYWIQRKKKHFFLITHPVTTSSRFIGHMIQRWNTSSTPSVSIHKTQIYIYHKTIVWSKSPWRIPNHRSFLVSRGLVLVFYSHFAAHYPWEQWAPFGASAGIWCLSGPTRCHFEPQKIDRKWTTHRKMTFVKYMNYNSMNTWM